MDALNNALFSKVGNLCSQAVYIWNELKLPGNTILQFAWACATWKWRWLYGPIRKSSMQLVCCLLHTQPKCIVCWGTWHNSCHFKSLCLCQNFPQKQRFWPLIFSTRFLKIICIWPQYCSSFTFFNYIKWWMMMLYQMPWKA